CVLVQGIPDAERSQPAPELLEEGLQDGLLDQQAAPRAADMTLVEVDAVDDALDGLVERGVVEDHVGRLAAQLQRDPLAGARKLTLDQLAYLGGSGERHLPDLRVARDQAPGP